jgi:hypothetical protein
MANTSHKHHLTQHDDHCCFFLFIVDPLTQFACAFSALIHDVDHVGVSNAQLVKEGSSLAARYKERSVAEQNSLDLSWDLLMQPRYFDLRKALFPSKDELVRFRQLVVNVSTGLLVYYFGLFLNGYSYPIVPVVFYLYRL